MNWKVGDKFWVDYEKLSKYGFIKSWRQWFPPSQHPFTVAALNTTLLFPKNGKTIDKKFTYVAKNQIVKQIIKDLL